MKRRHILTALDRIDLLFPSYLLLAAVALWSHGAPWLGEWQWTFDNINGATVLLGPYAAAAAAWRVSQVEANSVLFSSTQRGWAVPASQGIGVLKSAIAAWTLTGISAVVGTLLVVHGGPTPIWVLLAGPMVLATCIGVGVAAGHLWPNRIAAILVAPALFIFGGLGARGAVPNLLRQGPGTATLAGLRWDPANFLLEMATLGLVVLTCALLSARNRHASGHLSLVLVMASALGTVGVMVATHHFSEHRFVTSDEEPTLCARQTPIVCVAPSNARALSSLAATFREFLPAAEKLGLDLPPSFREILPNHSGGSDYGMIQLGADANASTASVNEVVQAIVTPGDCVAYYNPTAPPPDAVYQAQTLIGSLLIKIHSGDTSDLGNARMLAWVRDTYSQLRSCQLNAIKVSGRST